MHGSESQRPVRWRVYICLPYVCRIMIKICSVCPTHRYRTICSSGTTNVSRTGSRPVVLHQVSIGTHAVGQGGYADSIRGPKPKYLCGLVCLPSQQGGYCGPASIRIRMQKKYIDAVSGPRSTAYDRLTLAHMAVSYYRLQVVSLQSIVTLKSLAEGLQKYAWHGKLPKKQK